MKPQKQAFRHDPENGVWGDCHRTALAIIMDMDRDAIPHIEGRDKLQVAAFDAVIRTHFDVIQLHTAYPGSLSMEQVLGSVGHCNPNVAYILGGTSKNGCGHSVVCLNDKIVCDPSLDDSGIVGPMEDGMWWVTFLGAGVALSEAR